MLIKLILLIISIVYLLILPINFIFADKSYGIFNLVALLTFLFFWIVPIIYFYKKQIHKYSYLSILILINIIISAAVLYFGEKHSEKLQQELTNKIDKIQQHINEGNIRLKQ